MLNHAQGSLGFLPTLELLPSPAKSRPSLGSSGCGAFLPVPGRGWGGGRTPVNLHCWGVSHGPGMGGGQRQPAWHSENRETNLHFHASSVALRQLPAGAEPQAAHLKEPMPRKLTQVAVGNSFTFNSPS